MTRGIKCNVWTVHDVLMFRGVSVGMHMICAGSLHPDVVSLVSIYRVPSPDNADTLYETSELLSVGHQEVRSVHLWL